MYSTPLHAISQVNGLADDFTRTQSHPLQLATLQDGRTRKVSRYAPRANSLDLWIGLAQQLQSSLVVAIPSIPWHMTARDGS